MRKLFTALLLAATLLTGAATAKAEFPFDKPVTFIVPNAPGGAADIMVRLIADYFQKKFNITCNVVNKPGGGTAIGINEMLRARPDGYTYVFPGDSGVSVTPLISNVGFKLSDLKPMTIIGNMYITFATGKNSGFNDWKSTIEFAHTNPNEFVYATHNGISNQRLFMTYLMKRFHEGKVVRHTAYSSGHEVSTALLGKHINAGFQTIANQKPYVDSGDLQVIAIASPERSPLLPETPTFTEIYKDQLTPGDKKVLELSGWIGMFASAKVSDDKTEKILGFVKQALEDKGIGEHMEKLGMIPGYISAAEFTEIVNLKTELARDVLAGRKSLD